MRSRLTRCQGARPTYTLLILLSVISYLLCFYETNLQLIIDILLFFKSHFHYPIYQTSLIPQESAVFFSFKMTMHFDKKTVTLGQKCIHILQKLTVPTICIICLSSKHTIQVETFFFERTGCNFFILRPLLKWASQCISNFWAFE